ncbi:zinc ribbon domain-containing protein [Metallosphaera tengchongensis]|nr:zinc ribbon domain-containing protein [Metallosphaera tengchongensis]
MIHSCKSCGREYFEPRGVCKCGSDEFEEVQREVERGICVELKVTPSGFPERITFCLSKAGKTNAFEVE